MIESCLAIYPAAATMESLLRDLERSILGAKLGAVTDVAVSLAAACCAISLIGIGSKYLKGTGFDWWEFARPLLVFLLVCNFSTLVLGPIRGIIGVPNTLLAEAMGSSTESFKTLFREQATEMCHAEFGQGEDENTFEPGEDDSGLVRFLKKVGNKITRSFFRINEKMNLGAATLLSGVMFFFLNISLSVMVIIANLYLVLMALIGPFTFAISILTSYTRGIKLWVERYIQFTLWEPILHAMMFIGTEAMVLGNQAATWGGFFAWCFMCVAIYRMIKQTPTFASFIIESVGIESIANQLSGLGGDMIRKAGSASRLLK